ncbi:MAG: protein of unknown function transrane [Gemmatimonadetes bacterium]|nr:protein of unknown function transrane [Gemmatimonadota bacterium]
MSPLVLLLVLLSAVMHAWWNYLLKRAGGTQLFVALSKVAELLLFAPAFLVLGLPEARMHGASLLRFATVGAAFTLANYLFLGLAYSRDELSRVYPVARGAVLLFLPPLAYVTLEERLAPAGVAALALILAGILVLQLPSLTLDSVRGLIPTIARSPATGFALLAALGTASYTIWDKRAIQQLSAFTYFYTYTAMSACMYAAWVMHRHPRDVVIAEWQRNWRPILQVGFFNVMAYLLVLAALKSGVASYVVALRQLSIGFGVFLGWWLLGEPVGPPKRLGITLLVAGCIVVALAR